MTNDDSIGDTVAHTVSLMNQNIVGAALAARTVTRIVPAASDFRMLPVRETGAGKIAGFARGFLTKSFYLATLMPANRVVK